MNNFNQTQPPKTDFKRSWLLIFILLIALGSLSLASSGFVNKKMGELYQSDGAFQPVSQGQIYTTQDQLKIEGANNTWNVFGAAKPKITIVEFGDFTCPYCQQDFPIVRAMMVKYQDTVKFIYRDRTPTQRSLVLATVAQCAGEQGKFWPMHDKLFQYQTDSLGDNANTLIDLAKTINLDLDKFRLCLKDQKYLPKIKQSLQDSIDLAVNGTPTFYINGQKYQGVLTEENFDAIINELK